MKKLLIMLALIASIHAETWTCSTLIVANGDERIEKAISSTVAVKGSALTLSIKGVTPRTYHFLRDNLEGELYFKKDKGEGIVLISADIIVVIDGDDSYILEGCTK